MYFSGCKWEIRSTNQHPIGLKRILVLHFRTITAPGPGGPRFGVHGCRFFPMSLHRPN